jgi:hypothetical protein
MDKYVSMRELEKQGHVSYERPPNREIADEPWADKVQVSPSNVQFTVKQIGYERDGATGMNFHFIPSIPLYSVKGDITLLVSNNPNILKRVIEVCHQNVLIHMSPLNDGRVPRLEVTVTRVG